jgi:metallo-beta-lactamase family protein
VVLNGFSAHADQNDLLRFAKACRERGALERIALVHGEPKQQNALADALVGAGFPRPAIPAEGERMSC